MGFIQLEANFAVRDSAVHYLNLPKRAKHCRSFEKRFTTSEQFVPLNIKQKCVDEIQIKRKRVNLEIEKSNLCQEYNFSLKPLKEEQPCECTYRNKICTTHCKINFNDNITKTASDILAKYKYQGVGCKYMCEKPQRSHTSHSHLRTYKTRHALNQSTCHNSHRKHTPEKRIQLAALDLKRKQQLWEDRRNSTADLMKMKTEQNKSEKEKNIAHKSITHCRLIAETLCECDFIPNLNGLTSFSYREQCLLFFCRKFLSFELHRVFTMNLSKRKRRQFYLDNTIIMPKSTKKIICEFFRQNNNPIPMSCNEYWTFMVEEKEAATPPNGLTNGTTKSPKIKCDSNEIKGKNGIVNSVSEKLKKNSSKEKNETEQNCQTNGETITSRTSSRLKRKRDCGILGPYDADYVVDIPSYKKHKVKLLDSAECKKYSKRYEKKFKKSNAHRIQELTYKYTDIMFDNTIPIKENTKPKEVENHLVNCGFYTSNKTEEIACSPSDKNCRFCGLPFKNLTDKECSKHINQHNNSLAWPMLQVNTSELQTRPKKKKEKPKPPPPIIIQKPESKPAPTPTVTPSLKSQLASKLLAKYRPENFQHLLNRSKAGFKGMKDRQTARKSTTPQY